jgi:cyclic pyranopterin phosphate synthase
MLTDAFGRPIYYLRISVTDKCNYKCRYCMPEGGVAHKRHDEMLRYEDIALIASEAGKLGFNKLRLTGGEPLVKRDIEQCVALIADTGYFPDLCMTTNGSLLNRTKARALKQAGLSRMTVSLDTLDKEKFATITCGGCIDDVFAGIDAINEAGFTRTKINMVISNDTTQEELDGMRIFCDRKGVRLQCINRFSLADRTLVTTGIVVADRPPKCDVCNRIRITADGFIKSCLFSDNEQKIDLNAIQESLMRAVQAKPQAGVSCTTRRMNEIGG